jgi:PAS domain S-box-containing protein
VWGHQATPDAGFVQTAVYRLRAALREAGAGDIIENVRGVGYAIRGTRPDGDALLTRQVLEAAVRGLAQPLMILDSRQRIVLANDALAALSGYQVAELESLPTSAVLWPGDGQIRRQQQLERLFSGQSVRASGEHLERRDRTVVTVNLLGRPLAIEDRVIGVILECSQVS